MIPFDAITLFSFAPAAVQHLAFEIHVVSRFDSARIECVAQTQFNYRRICTSSTFLITLFLNIRLPIPIYINGLIAQLARFECAVINRL